METIAVYWEKRIKTYGFNLMDGLVLMNLEIEAGRLEDWGHRIADWGGLGVKVRLVLAQASDDGGANVSLVLDRGDDERLEKEFSDDEGFEVVRAVEMIQFQGPHFGDRYGIAEAAFDCLAAAGLPVLAAGCAGASIHIILPEGRGAEAVARLSETFEVAGIGGG